MYRRTITAGWLFAVLTPALAPRLAAQCPDGTPPPCRQVTPGGPAARAALDENLVAIFPFRISGSSPDAAALREGAMDLMGLALDEQAGFQVVPSRTLLARARGFTDATPVAAAAAIARGLGAGYMILGSAVVAGPQVRARAVLHDLLRRRAVVSVESRGLATDPAPVIDSLASALARQRLAAGVARRPIQEFATTSPVALRLYLAAEREARGGAWQAAADSLQRAIAIDSSFALALYRLLVMSTWGANVLPWTSEAILLRADAASSRLPRRHLDLIRAALALYRGEAREALALADALGARYPDDAEVAYAHGEAYFHIGLAFGEPPERALEAFERAIGIDSSVIDPYNHASELRLMIGDSARALELAREGAARAPASGVHRAVLLAARAIVAHEDPARLAAETRQLRQDVAGSTDVLFRAAYEAWRMLTRDPARALLVGEGFLTAAAAPDRGRTNRTAGMLALAQSRVLQGRYREARTILDTVLQSDPTAEAARRGTAIVAWLEQGGLAARDTVALAGLIAAAPDDSGPLLAEYRRNAATAARGLRLLAAGDTTAARAELARIPPFLPYSISSLARFSDVVQWGLLAVARLEGQAGLSAQAQARLGYGVFTAHLVPARPELEEALGHIAAQRGDTATALRALRAFIALWRDADPPLQPRVAAARALLGGLQAAPRGTRP